jgi:hypothetical protein
MSEINWYEKAMARLDAESELNTHRDTITSDWNESDHWEWVATAEVKEIVDWAEEIEQGEADAQDDPADDFDLYSTSEVAGQLGLQPAQVRNLAARLNVGRKVGKRAWAFTARDVARMQERDTKRGPKFNQN